MIEPKITKAFHTPTDKIINIKDAENGNACNCTCLKCNEPLMAVQGKINTHHFRHIVESDCNGLLEGEFNESSERIKIDWQPFLHLLIAIGIVVGIIWGTSKVKKGYY